jgi:hypothetical protein
METYRIKQVFAFMLTSMLFAVGLNAQGDEFTRVIERSFPIDDLTNLAVNNMYGNVNIMNHDENTIAIEVVVKVNIRDRDRAEEMLDMVNIAIAQEGNTIKAETSINNNINRIFRGFNIGGGGLEINYAIHMPPNVPVNLANKYGNVFIDELTSTSTIDVKYGKLNANRILHDSHEPLTKLTLAYSDAVVQEASWLNADIKYSKLDITESKALVVFSKYSKIFITNGSSVVSDSKYDTFDMGKLNNFVITTAYSNIKVDELSAKFQVESKYTDVNVGRIPAGFETVKINSSYGNYRIGIEDNASYRLDGYAKYCNINYPDNNSRINRIEENNELTVDGVIGGKQTPRSEVTVSSSYCNIRLQ